MRISHGAFFCATPVSGKWMGKLSLLTSKFDFLWSFKTAEITELLREAMFDFSEGINACERERDRRRLVT